MQKKKKKKKENMINSRAAQFSGQAGNQNQWSGTSEGNKFIDRIAHLLQLFKIFFSKCYFTTRDTNKNLHKKVKYFFK